MVAIKPPEAVSANPLPKAMSVPTREEFCEIIERARHARLAAAQKTYDELPPAVQAFPDMARACGGANLLLHVDGRTAMGKFLTSLIDNPLPNMGVGRRGSSFILYILPHVPHQHAVVHEAAEEAALEVIKSSLGIDGSVSSYLS